MTRDGFTITAVGGGLLVLVAVPPAAAALLLSPAGVRVDFPFAASRVVATVVHSGGKPPKLMCRDADGTVTGQPAAAAEQQPGPQTLSVHGQGMVMAELRGHEARLLSICIERDGSRGRQDERTKKMEPKRTDPMTKLDAALRTVVERSKGREQEVVDVIVSLEPRAERSETGAPPAGAAADEAARFEAETRPLVDRLRALGAVDVQSLWIARAIAARLPAGVVLELAREERVRKIALNTKRKIIL